LANSNFFPILLPVSTKEIISPALFNAISDEYGSRTALPLLLCDGSGDVMHSRIPEDHRWQFALPEECGEKLREWRANIAENSSRWGEAYFTTTPMGLIAFAVPLMEGDSFRGSFISGFVAFPEMAGDMIPDITKGMAQLGAACTEGFVEQIAIRTVNRHQIRHFADLLMKIMVRHGLLDRRALAEKREKTAQQLNIAHCIEHVKKADKNVAGSIIDKQEEIIVRVKRGDITGAKEILNEYLGYIFFDTGMNFDIIKIRIIELIVLMSRSAIELGAASRELLKLNQGYLAELNRTEDYETLCLSVAGILENFIGRISTIMIDKKRMKVRLMLDYIHQNFTDGITAADVAKAVNLSAGRALHLLTRETGLSFTGHVTRCRVDYARYLLLNTDDTIADIALQAGFYDHSQFTRTFKSLEKATPLRFRKRFRT
jgi:two-component system, response regulator YesN